MKNQVSTEQSVNDLDAEKQQEHSDCEEEGNITDPLYEHLYLGDHNEQQGLRVAQAAVTERWP